VDDLDGGPGGGDICVVEAGVDVHVNCELVLNCP
jgi:hypothetical protein